MQTFLKNGYIVSMEQNDTVFDGGGELVENDRKAFSSDTECDKMDA